MSDGSDGSSMNSEDCFRKRFHSHGVRSSTGVTAEDCASSGTSGREAQPFSSAMMNARVEGAGRSSVAVDGLIAQQTCSNILAAVYTRDQRGRGLPKERQEHACSFLYIVGSVICVTVVVYLTSST